MPRSEGRPAPPGPPGGTKLAPALLVLLPACRLFGPESPKGRNEDVNRSLLERLLTGDVVTPVQDFDQESYFDELERLYAGCPLLDWESIEPAAFTGAQAQA